MSDENPTTTKLCQVFTSSGTVYSTYFVTDSVEICIDEMFLDRSDESGIRKVILEANSGARIEYTMVGS
jgi:hypothetical protein